MKHSLILSLLLAAGIPFGANAQSQDGCVIMIGADSPAPVSTNGGQATRLDGERPWGCC